MHRRQKGALRRMLWKLYNKRRFADGTLAMEMAKKREMLEYIGADPDNWENAVLPIIKTIMRSHAAITIFPMQDLLGYGKDTRMNTPGKASGNWAIRLKKAQLNSLDTKYFCHLNEIYHRKG